MDKTSMNNTIKQELEHIPPGEKGGKQNRFRSAYTMTRQSDLGRNPSAPRNESLNKAIEAFRKAEYDPEFTPEFDKAYFGRD